jgi:hypothetical protein
MAVGGFVVLVAPRKDPSAALRRFEAIKRSDEELLIALKEVLSAF